MSVQVKIDWGKNTETGNYLPSKLEQMLREFKVNGNIKRTETKDGTKFSGRFLSRRVSFEITAWGAHDIERLSILCEQNEWMKFSLADHDWHFASSRPRLWINIPETGGKWESFQRLRPINGDIYWKHCEVSGENVVRWWPWIIDPETMQDIFDEGFSRDERPTT